VNPPVDQACFPARRPAFQLSSTQLRRAPAYERKFAEFAARARMRAGVERSSKEREQVRSTGASSKKGGDAAISSCWL